jgi:hypothetical protein
VTLVGGHLGNAYQFTGAGGGKGGGAQPAGTNVEHKWASDVPVYVRAMALADRQLVIVGPPDIINEHETFARLSARDTEVNELLNRQNSALSGEQGSKLLVIDSDLGEVRIELSLDTLPVWDGLASADGKLYLTTTDGRVLSFTGNADDQ